MNENIFINKWNKEEDEKLINFFKENKSKKFSKWKLLEELFPNKTASQIAERWKYVLNPEIIKKKSWTAEEDTIIKEFIENKGYLWKELAKKLSGRTSKQIRQRWLNSLQFEKNKENWTLEEENLLIELVNKYGNQWEIVSKFFPNCSSINFKNKCV